MENLYYALLCDIVRTAESREVVEAAAPAAPAPAPLPGPPKGPKQSSHIPTCLGWNATANPRLCRKLAGARNRMDVVSAMVPLPVRDVGGSATATVMKVTFLRTREKRPNLKEMLESEAVAAPGGASTNAVVFHMGKPATPPHTYTCTFRFHAYSNERSLTTDLRVIHDHASRRPSPTLEHGLHQRVRAKPGLPRESSAHRWSGSVG